jgi:hypothetical protein
MCAVWAVAAVVTAAIGLVRTAPPAAEPVPVIHVFVERGLAAAPFERVPAVAAAMLATAGVRSRWRFCATETPCDDLNGFRPTATVIIRTGAGRRNADPCATASRAPDRATGTIVVYHRCVDDALRSIRYGAAGRMLPRLKLLQLGDVIGLVVAHEIGHVAGLRHAKGGVMHARLNPEDLLAFQEGSLAFARTEAATLRTALLVARPQSTTARKADR